MSKTLGLDLGTNSIGWAVVDKNKNEILGMGSRIFPMGVEDLGTSKEMSKNATRRIHRQTRRQFYRKRLRKIKLLELLIKHEMCPLTSQQLKQWKFYDKTKGKAGMQFPSTPKFNEWLKLNPYQLRAEGLERNLSKEEFGRVLYHLIQRRGFWSNRKVKEEGTISKGKDNVVGIAETMDKLEDFPTLGSFLYHISYKDGEKFKRITNKEGKELRVRSRYTLRQMYIDEFESLWKQQAEPLGLDKIKEKVKKTYPVGNPYREGEKENGLKKRLEKRVQYLADKGIQAQFTNDNDPKNTKLIVEKSVTLKELLGGGTDVVKREDSVLFWQRPLRNQKFLLDECSFEKTIWEYNGELFYQRKNPSDDAKLVYAGKKPCPISHPLAELRRAYEFINNIEYGDGVRLNEDQRQTVLDLINSKDGNFDFEKIPEKLGLEQEKFNYDDKHKVPGNYTHKHLKPLFSKEIWEEHFEEIWHCFYFYTDSEKLFKKLKDDFDLDIKQEDKIRGKKQPEGTRKGGIILKDEHANLSLKAIKNILPFLEKRYKYSDAVLLGGVKNAFASRWDYFESSHNEVENTIIDINRNKTNKEGEAIEKIKAYLVENDFGFEPADKAFYSLYHHSQATEKRELKDELDEPGNLRNPLVQQALYELKGLVKAISKEYLEKGEHFEKIKVEMARDLKQSKERRTRQGKENKLRQQENEEARATLDEFGLSHSRNNVHKYLLWKELQNQGGNAICPYTGKTISLADLFNDNKFQIEHIIPYSKSLDDSFSNKTICDAKENGEKGEKTPYQFYISNKNRWEEVKDRAFKVLPYHKAKRFTSKEAHKTDFISSQLNDTRYISKAGRDYLSQICEDVQVFPGQLTADLRRKWGLDTILSPPVEVNEEVDFGRVWAQMNDEGEPVAFYPIFNKPPKYEKCEFVITGWGNKKDKDVVFQSDYLKVDLNFSVDGWKNGKHWVEVKGDGSLVKKFPQGEEPVEGSGNHCIKIEVKDKKLTKSCFRLSFPVKNGINDGKYWAKIKVSGSPIKLVKILRPKPETNENEILLYGKTDYKGKFISKYLSGKQDGKDIDNETVYWAKVTVLPESTKLYSIRDKKMPKSKKNNVLIYGKVKNGEFTSRTYSCKTTEPDGRYNALLEVDLESISFHKVKNDEPKVSDNQIKVVGNVNDGNLQPNIARKEFYDAPACEDGLHWAVFELRSDPHDFIIVENPEPKIENGELVKGVIAVAEVIEADENTGEVLKEEKKKYFFHGKERGDHRHHAIDALTVAMTEQGYLQRLSTYNANKKAKNRDNEYDKSKLSFPMPWDNFREDAEKQVKRILVSHKKVSKVLTKKTTEDPNTGKEFEGIGARGQLHEASVYGKRYDNPEQTSKSYRKRVSLTDLTPLMIRNIADRNIREMVFEQIENEGFKLDDNQKPIVKGKAAEKRFKEVLSKPLFLKNTKGGEPVPVKKVRVVVSMKGIQLTDINQHVIPGENNRLIIYEDSKENLKYHPMPFWDAVEKKKQKTFLNQLPSEDSDGQFIEAFQKGDMFLLGLKNKGDIEELSSVEFSESLYKVQKIGGNEDYFEICFRHHLDSRPDKEAKMDYKYIKGFGAGKTGWHTHSPVRVIVTRTGKIEVV